MDSEPMSAQNRGTIAAGLTCKIVEAHEAASTAARSALAHALEAGRLLVEAKELVPHGGWADYVAECGMPTRTAAQYMRLHRGRDDLGDRQRVADLTVREAARLLAKPKPRESEQMPTETGRRFDFLGGCYATLDSVSCQFNPDWKFLPLPLYAAAVGERTPTPPPWYAAGRRHVGQHESGWCFEIAPDQRDRSRVNGIVHDAEGSLHLASFSSMRPEGIMPLLTAAEQNHQMPSIDSDWTIETMLVPSPISELAEPFVFEVFRLASRPLHRCLIWQLVDEALGLEPCPPDPGLRAWSVFGAGLAAFVRAHGIPGPRPNRGKSLPR